MLDLISFDKRADDTYFNVEFKKDFGPIKAGTRYHWIRVYIAWNGELRLYLNSTIEYIDISIVPKPVQDEFPIGGFAKVLLEK